MRRIDRFVDTLQDDEVDELLSTALRRRPATEAVSAKYKRTQLAHISEFEAAAKERLDNWGGIQGLSTGYSTLDEMTKGLVNGELIILSGFTSHGKTQVATNIAYRVASKGTPVLFATLEQSHAEITSRLMKIAEPGSIEGLPVFFQLEQSLNYRDIPLLVSRAKTDGARLVIVDHLQMLARSVENQTGESAKVVMEMKKAAIQNDIPVILISHTRKVNDKVDGRRRPPELEDLKDTSAIAQDADIVLFVYRNLEDEGADNDEVIVALAKNRNRGVFKKTRKHNFKSEGVRLDEF